MQVLRQLFLHDKLHARPALSESLLNFLCFAVDSPDCPANLLGWCLDYASRFQRRLRLALGRWAASATPGWNAAGALLRELGRQLKDCFFRWFQ